jgi:hypothetical protein
MADAEGGHEDGPQLLRTSFVQFSCYGLLINSQEGAERERIKAGGEMASKAPDQAAGSR